MYPCYSRAGVSSSVLYDSEGNVCSEWEALTNESRNLIFTGVSIVGATLLGLSVYGILRYARRRKRSEIMAHSSKLPTMTIARHDYRGRNRGMPVATPTADGKRHDEESTLAVRTRSRSLSSTHPLSPSPLRQVRVTSHYIKRDVNPLPYQNTIHYDVHRSGPKYTPARREYTDYVKEPMANDDGADLALIANVREHHPRL